MKYGKEESGFTLIEAVAAWTVLLIALTIFLKCMVTAQSSFAEGAALRNVYGTAYNHAEAGQNPDRKRTTELKFRMDGTDTVMEAEILEYGAGSDNGEETAVLKVLVPLQKTEE